MLPLGAKTAPPPHLRGDDIDHEEWFVRFRREGHPSLFSETCAVASQRPHTHALTHTHRLQGYVPTESSVTRRLLFSGRDERSSFINIKKEQTIENPPFYCIFRGFGSHQPTPSCRAWKIRLNVNCNPSWSVCIPPRPPPPLTSWRSNTAHEIVSSKASSKRSSRTVRHDDDCTRSSFAVDCP